MPDRSIKIIPIEYHQVRAILESDALKAIEEPIAAKRGLAILYDFSSASTTYTLADISVSGMSSAQLETLLREHRDRIITFGILFACDQEANRDEEEYPEGEEPDEDEDPGEVLGLGCGFGIKYAIYYNFVANRTPAELRAYLKNRRIPQAAKFAMALERIFRGTLQVRNS